MDITYDPRYNIAYIRLRKKAAGDDESTGKTRELSLTS